MLWCWSVQLGPRNGSGRREFPQRRSRSISLRDTCRSWVRDDLSNESDWTVTLHVRTSQTISTALCTLLWPALLCVAVASSPGDDQPRRELPAGFFRMKAAYSSPSAYRVSFRNVSRFDTSIDSKVVDRFAKSPEIERVAIPGSTAQVFLADSCVLWSDGADLVRVETLSLLSGGPRSHRTSVETWTEDLFSKAGRLDMGEAEVRSWSPLSHSARVNAFTEGLTTYEHYRAGVGYLQLAQYCIRAVGDADDANEVVDPNGVSTIRVPSIGLEVRIDAHTGELLACTQADATGFATEWRFSDWLPGAWFPSRHPRRLCRGMPTGRAVTAADSASEGAADFTTVFDSIARADPPQLKDCDWRQFANYAYRPQDEVVVEHDGQVNASRTEARRSPVVAGPSNFTVTEAGTLEVKPQQLAASRVLWIVAASAFVLAGIVWWRRHSR